MATGLVTFKGAIYTATTSVDDHPEGACAACGREFKGRNTIYTLKRSDETPIIIHFMCGFEALSPAENH